MRARLSRRVILVDGAVLQDAGCLARARETAQGSFEAVGFGREVVNALIGRFHVNLAILAEASVISATCRCPPCHDLAWL